MVLKQRHNSASSAMLQSPPPSSGSAPGSGSGSGSGSGGMGISRQQHLVHLAREGSAVSLPYGSALSPTSGGGPASASSSSSSRGLGNPNNIVRRSQSAAAAGGGSSSVSASASLAQHRPSHLSMSPAPSSSNRNGGGVGGSAYGPLSPTFFGTGTPTPTKKRRSFWSSIAAACGGSGGYDGPNSTLKGRRLASSPSKGAIRNPYSANAHAGGAPSLRPALFAALYVVTILSCGYLTVVTGRRLADREARLSQMKNDYHILHHKVRETQSALQTANQINHDLEDRSKALTRTNDQLQQELDDLVQRGVKDAVDALDPARLLGRDEDDDSLQGLQAEEITSLLMRRQDAMKGRIGTLQTKIQQISRREAEER